MQKYERQSNIIIFSRFFRLSLIAFFVILKNLREIRTYDNYSVSPKYISLNAYRLNTASHNILRKSDLLDR